MISQDMRDRILDQLALRLPKGSISKLTEAGLGAV